MVKGLAKLETACAMTRKVKYVDESPSPWRATTPQ